MANRNYVSSLSFHIGADAREFLSSMQKMQSGLQSFGRQMQSIGTTFSAVFTAPLAAAGIGAVKLAADVEQVEVAFTTMLGSAEKAGALLKDLQSFAAETPFQFPELQRSAKSLLAFGIEADKIVPTLKQIGDISAGIGAPVGEIAEIFGKARVQGRLFAEDINQLTGRGIPVIQELAKQFGVAESEVKKLVESGQVSFTNLQQAFTDLTSEGGKFAGLMQAQSNTLSGIWSTMSDNISLALTELGKDIVETFDLKTTIKQVSSIVGQAVAAFKSLSPEVRKTVIVGTALAAAIPPLLAGFGTLLTLAPAIGTAFAAITGPVGIAVAAIGGLAALVTNYVDVFGLANSVLKGDSDATWSHIKNGFKRFLNDMTGLTASLIDLFINLNAKILGAIGLGGLADGLQQARADLRSFAESLRFDDVGTSTLDNLKARWESLKGTMQSAQKAAEAAAGAASGATTGTTGGLALPGTVSPLQSGVPGLGALSLAVPAGLSNLVQQVEPVKQTFADLSAVIQQDFGAAIGFISNGVSSIAGSFAELALSGKASIGDFAKVVIDTLKKMVTQLLITAAAGFLVKTIIGSLIPGLQGGNLSGFGKFLKGINTALSGGIPSLATGGYLKQDSLINAHKGEIVAPLNRLPQLNPGGLKVDPPEVRIAGEDILLSWRRSNERYNRNT